MLDQVVRYRYLGSVREDDPTALHSRDLTFHHLTNRRHAASPRHRTLHATLDWSYKLLSATEQLVLRRCAVFAGGFDLASARAIASDNDIGGSDVLNGILSLGAKSLITADVSNDNVIYRLLDTTRAYARNKLRSSHESAEISRRHAEFLCGVWGGGRARPRGNAEWLERDGRKIDDVRAALDWCFSPNGDALLGQRLTAASSPLWFRLYVLNEYGRRLQRALQTRDAASTLDAKLEMKLNLMLGHARLYTGDPGLAAEFKTAIEIADRLGDTATLCRYPCQLSPCSIFGTHVGGRFSMKARMPSRGSGEWSSAQNIVW